MCSKSNNYGQYVVNGWEAAPKFSWNHVKKGVGVHGLV